ncbi:MAG TPA: MFS transporter [Acidimicrobiia bacterium]|nr:MFS transporter [Acidimicrobiia bacterium]
MGRAFRLLFAASTISNVGDGVLVVALPLLARDLTTDPVAVSMVTVAATAPWLLFGLLAGAVVDRHDRRRLMVVADVARAGTLGVLAAAVAADVVSLPLLAVTVFVLGVGETIFDTASQALLPTVVEHERLEAANGRLFGAQIAANSFVGPPLGAALFAVALMLPLAADAATFAVSALLVAAITTPPAAPRPKQSSLLADVREGLRWLWGDGLIRAFAIGAAVVNLAHTAVLATIVLFVRDDLGVGSFAFALTLAGASIGGIVGAATASVIVGWVGRRAAVLASVAGFSASLLVAGTATNVVVVAIGLAGFGVAGEVWNVVAVSYRQARVPEHLLGRVMAGYRCIAYGAMPVGAALGGVLADGLGLRAPFIAGALLTATLLVYLVPVSRDRALRA